MNQGLFLAMKGYTKYHDMYVAARPILADACSLQVARKIWLGGWNPTRDREPSKKDEQAFKQFLITKYERKNWYRSPSEVAKETPSPTPETKADHKIEPPPSKVRGKGSTGWVGDKDMDHR